MKKYVLLVTLFCGSFIFAQSSYSEYKKQREYEEKYANEKWQKIEKELNEDLTTFNQYTGVYIVLVEKYKSISYVEKNSPNIASKRREYHAYLLANSNLFNRKQSEFFQKIVNRYNLLFNDYRE